MPRQRVELGGLSVEALQPRHIEAVRQWRNAQIAVLRQSTIIEPEQQEAYYAEHIWPDMPLQHPRNILLAYSEQDRFIGYGGLVHIAWEHRRAEISFLLDTALAGTPRDHAYHFPQFLKLMKVLAFDDLCLERLCTETYAVRGHYIAALDGAGFHREGVMRQHVRIDGRPVDAVLHGCLRSEHRAQKAFQESVRGHVLVASASKKVPLVQAVQKTLRRLDPAAKVIAGDLDEDSPARHVAEGFWQMPPTDDTAFDELLRGCRERGIRTVIPTRDGELCFWAGNRERFAAAGIDVLVSPAESVTTCLDKLAFARFGRERALPFIPAASHPDELGEGPFVVKERFGAGARGVGLNLDRAAAFRHGASLESPIYQPFIAGREISVDAWLDRSHQVKGLVLRSRDRVVEGESQVTTTFRDSRIEEAAAEVLQLLKLCGPVVMQVLIDAQGGLHVIECNARFGGASTASIAAGLDVFYWSLLEGCGVDLSDYPFDRLPGDLRQIRLPGDIHIHGSDF